MYTYACMHACDMHCRCLYENSTLLTVRIWCSFCINSFVSTFNTKFQCILLECHQKRLKDRDSRHKAEVAALEERVSQLQRENEAAETDRKDLITAREEIEELHHENAEREEQMKSLEVRLLLMYESCRSACVHVV